MILKNHKKTFYRILSQVRSCGKVMGITHDLTWYRVTARLAPITTIIRMVHDTNWAPKKFGALFLFPSSTSYYPKHYAIATSCGYLQYPYL